mgnify:CR=1 FL=1
MSDATNPAPEPVDQPETILLLGAEGGSLSLKRASRRASPGAKGAREHARTEDEVFWIERDERTLRGLCREVDLPGPLSTRSETRNCFTDAMKDLLEVLPWRLLSPRYVHPAWAGCIHEALDLRFPGWVDEPERYSDTWDTVHAWRRALQPAPFERDTRALAGTQNLDRHPRKKSS